jgi:hypothetical protein
MPFTSKAQLRTCYGKLFRGINGSWDCDEWALRTPNASCLPENKGPGKQCKALPKSQRLPSAVKTGPRGGEYLTVGGIDMYLPKDSQIRLRVARMYGLVNSPKKSKKESTKKKVVKRSRK